MQTPYIITLPGKPLLYSPFPLPGWEMVGEIIRNGEAIPGALVRNAATGIYAQANAGKIRTLDQRAVAKALAATVPLDDDKKPGPPPAEHRVDWTAADWTLTNAELSRIHGVSRQSVAAARRRYQKN